VGEDYNIFLLSRVEEERRTHGPVRGPVIASYEPGERWAWCYVDQTEVDVPEQFLPYLR
jgi:hypothetical protein